MSLIRWLHGSSSSKLEENEDEAMVAANKEVEKVKQVQRKRARYHHCYHYYNEHVLTLPNIRVNVEIR